MITPDFGETLVAINRLGKNQYQVVELPRCEVQTTQSHEFQTRQDAQDHVDENWTYGNYRFVEPQNIETERSARKA